ncbi:7,8-didemethyl-8-hydroxy-5-deazariboflavin synthase subunit CofG [Methanonatronarchaeum sp. AMET6-2]|uniref:7,8-didemethyl-8-hydroxy-5-deazariboflavin synthase subunit CofG n=1 Tax=Methanonatronarchaeum sp. AMET6-2 TaxID=2933293 RepID=UPI001FF4515B|nr:7,8-didemethyl-8-hydroxy-5-deazariboflavin synthase subunit CofG [Methanonatronarchaeum sp. AMET6-2]UOY10242.1 7,8-didemethyl-8-hydroxy-5-deazariboflavin synthase subunit CofG [Methanonatronarchaeum sp. AMET6-2]
MDDSQHITYSRNVFIPITNICRNNCGYCGFQSGEPYLIGPERAREIMKEGLNQGAVEALFTFGEQPQENRVFQNKLRQHGYDSFTNLLIDIFKSAIEMGLLPHTNPGCIPKKQFKELAEYNASMGLMLETTASLPIHTHSPGKEPEKRLELLRYAGEQKIPFTTGILVGIGEKIEDRIESLREIQRIHDRYGHIQEVILQGHSKHPSSNTDLPSAGQKEVLKTVRKADSILDGPKIQVPPNLHPDIKKLVRAGVRDIGGLSTTKDHINPEAGWPSISMIKEQLKTTGYKLKLRPPIHQRYIDWGWYPPRLEDNLRRFR